MVWGRLYCGRVCAFGALTQLMDKVVPARFRVAVPPALERRAGYIKYGLLALVLLVFFITRNPTLLSLRRAILDVLRHASVLEWTGLGVLLVATVLCSLYCRFLCPWRVPRRDFAGDDGLRIKRWSVQDLQDLRRPASGARSDRRSSAASACGATTASALLDQAVPH